MSFFKNIFNTPKPKESNKSDENLKDLSLDQIFVNNFIDQKGKFLYCTSLKEISLNLTHIIEENKWDKLVCNDLDLLKILKSSKAEVIKDLNSSSPIFISCEHLIAENGSILFSSNQLKETKISNLSQNFIVYATTSQIVSSKGEALTGIKTHYKGNIPSNISAINNYNLDCNSDDFLNYGNTNSKNLYLLLFEDL